ncbi:MAG: response regulator transcription factor [bacterium]|nr:response regulator transcription factor [bacterium]
MFNILIAEDERDIRHMMSEYLSNNGYNIFEAADGEAALDVLDETYIDLLITDIMMPKMNGYHLTKVLREAGYELPILMITAKETIDDKENGYRSGTDDYMVKPIVLRELLLRVNALLKRVKTTSEKKITLRTSAFDLDSFTAVVNGKSVEIPKKEFMLLFCLLSRPGKIFTRQQLLDEIWGYDTESGEGTVNVHISRLRERLRGCTDFEIVTVKGLGIKAVLK